MEALDTQQAWFLKSSCPVFVPSHDALSKSQIDFDAWIVEELRNRHDADATGAVPRSAADDDVTNDADSETFTLVDANDVSRGLASMDIDPTEKTAGSHTFIQGLISHQKKQASRDKPDYDMDNKILTDNGDVAHRSTTSDIVDLFHELEHLVSGPRLIELLDHAWSKDALATLKIIFNARSIHLGKGSRNTFYRACGWLAQEHPLTLVANLRWLSRPVVEKKVAQEGEDDIFVVEKPRGENDPARFDVQHGVAHGYWKDMLNMLALAVNGELSPLSDPRNVLNSENPGILRGKSISENCVTARISKRRANQERSRGRSQPARGDIAHESEKRRSIAQIRRAKDPKKERHETRQHRHRAAVRKFTNNATYRALHLTVARLFAEQLQCDFRLLGGNDIKVKKGISLCGKWAPSHDRFHDKHTFIVSSIAEIMHPRASLPIEPTEERETYLRHAREEYRKDISALRKHLEVVEREITSETFDNIKYDRLPSVAMKNYSKLFIEKDFDRFYNYLDDVAAGRANISGATLLPSTMVRVIRSGGIDCDTELSKIQLSAIPASKLVELKKMQMQARVLDGQWNALVQRIRDSGKLSSSIAVCDVSGSMTHPQFPDGTCPMDSAIGLSLLVAEVTQPPFGGAFITFSNDPQVQQIPLSSPFTDKVHFLRKSAWGMSTDFVAVFEKLILPMAVQNGLAQEDMVKRVFVFSDMHFNQADHANRPANSNEGNKTWDGSYDRIQKMYAEAGYEMPELVFWDLAGGSAGAKRGGTSVAPKPVTTKDRGTSLVSGYSQGMLKVFMGDGQYDDEEKGKGVNAMTDPGTTVKRAIGHKAYGMLEVLD